MSCCELRYRKAYQAGSCRPPANRSTEAPQTRREAHTSTAAAGDAEAEAPPKPRCASGARAGHFSRARGRVSRSSGT